MNKCISVLLLIYLMLNVSTGCSSLGGPQPESNSPNASVGVANMSEITEKGIPQPDNSPKSLAGSVGEVEDVAVDLTALSSTMVYAEVYNILMNPDDYLGKTIRMSGLYTPTYYDVTDRHYHFVLIEDATACCTQGLEFIWSGGQDFPDEYPAENTRIDVSGVYDSYVELDEVYYYLAVEEIIILS